MRPLPSCHLLMSGSFPLNLPLPNCCPNIRCVLKCLRGHRSSADEDDWWTHPVTRSNFHPYFPKRPFTVSFPPSSLAHIRAEYNLTVELIPFTTECPNKRTQLLVFLVRRISSAFQFSSFRPRRGTATPKVRRCVTSARRHRRVCPPPKRDVLALPSSCRTAYPHPRSCQNENRLPAAFPQPRNAPLPSAK
jgi:hypothetical protein